MLRSGCPVCLLWQQQDSPRPHSTQTIGPISSKPAAVMHTSLFLLLAQALGAAGCASTSLGDRCLIRSWLALHIPQQPGGIQLWWDNRPLFWHFWCACSCSFSYIAGDGVRGDSSQANVCGCLFSIREQKGKSEMKRGSRTGRKAKARPPKAHVITVSKAGLVWTKSHLTCPLS